jgi:hypothetical protein
LESEWGNPRNLKGRAAQIESDFEKLLSFKAPIKLLTFETSDTAMRKEIHDAITRKASNFRQHVKGECYIFAEFSQGKCFTYLFEVPSDGKVAFSLGPLDVESKDALIR